MKAHARPEEQGRGLDSRIEHLKAVSLFSDIREIPEALEALSRLLVEKRYPSETAIIQEGAAGSELFVLISGQASVYKTTAEGEPYKVAILNGAQRTFFGEGALLEADSRSATIKADTECHCLVLDRPAFVQFSNEHPQWALPIIRRIAHAVMARLQKANTDLMLIYNALVAEIRGH